MATNWLLELGIPFDPAPSPEEVARLLDEREREFGLKANKGSRGSYYSVMLERLDSIRAELSDKKKIEQLADEAQSISYPVVDQLIQQAASDGNGQLDDEKVQELTGLAQDLIADRMNTTHVQLPDGLIESRMDALAPASSGGSDESDQAQKLYRSLVGKKPSGQHKYRSFEDDLGIFGVDNLYDYALGVGAPWDEMSKANEKDLLERIESKVGDYQKGTSERSAAERLRSRAREVCGSAEEWQRYCTYLIWRDTKESLERLGRMARLGSGAVSVESFERVTDKIAVLQGDDNTAKLIVRGYCETHNPPITMPRASTKAASADEMRNAMPRIQADSSGINLVTCPHCGKRTSSGSFCMECGGSLSTSSPTGASVAARTQTAAATTYQSGAQQANPVLQQQYQLQGASSPGWTAQAQMQAQQAAYTSPPVQPEKKSKAPAAIAIILVIVAVALVAFVALGGLDKLKSGPEQVIDTGVVQADPSSMVDCSASTRITPQFADGSLLERYRVALSQRPESEGGGAYSDQLMELNVEGGGGFSMQDYSKYGAALSDKMYQLTITDTDTNREYRLFVNYVGASNDAPKSVDFLCK